MPAVKLSPLFNDQTATSTGAPASGYKVYTYAAGSSTQLATYTDSSGTVAQSNPIILNASGYPTNGPIWLQTGLSYKFVLADASGSVIRTIDNVTGVNDTSTSTSQWLSAGAIPTYVSATSFTLAGDQTTEFHAGRRAQFTVSAGTVYGDIKSSTYSAGLTTVTMVMDGASVLDSGLSSANLSILRADFTAIPFAHNYIYIRDEKTNGTDGGASSAGTQTRTLNTKVSDIGSHSTLSANQITLSAGTYRMRARAPAFTVNRHKLRLRNVTAGTTLLVGSSSYAGGTGATQTDAELLGRFTVAAGQALELQHYTQTAVATVGLGTATSSGDAEVFAEIEFWREA